MDSELCENFDIVIENYPDELKNSEEYDIHGIHGIEEYCLDEESREKKCKTELSNINATCLWLLNKNIANRIDDLSNEQAKSVIIYIMIWLNYMLNLKNDGKINLNNFYTIIEKNANYTNCTNGDNDCSNKLKGKTGYNNFKDVIVKNMDFSNINFEDISKFYDAFKLLCKMHTESNDGNIECNQYLEYVNNIVDKFKKLNDDSSISGDSSYSKVWYTLSTDYDSFKKKCDSFPSFPSIKITQHQIKSSEHGSVQSSDVTSSSLSIVKKLILALSIFSATTIFLGIFFKCSLFILRKRSQKQHLREKLKNIKKRMNH
ncbi:PIR protein [Plasmodium yoelii]|uniref:Yir1 protein n=3 Tax=Plasmodium yoelii TaxID=5861 RepID=Q7R8F4_PLAYO|nr:PIR protein [Plasmodium yoelii]EAA19660.1 putative yir1 protein [Plasmodium yoelii yoelii]WBY56175.1 PIR protein [Plasmodium yoelii yoelii]CDS44055.1 YIR protein [Plasmodium yoelii]VTZ76106.1 PIR protein [Plasmodium yoelii]|eukprot:XP_034493440.1 PIR protein [Plasmodium yoelii]